MLKILCLLLFAVSFLGYFHFLVNVKKVSIFAAPVIIVTSICAIMCIAGLVNTMPVCVYMILTIGIFLLLKYKSVFSVKALSGNEFSLILCAALLVYLAYYTKGAVYADGDTMTHWGVIVKSIYRNGRLPNFTDLEIEYQAYPPATACWIFFALKLLGYSEARALLAQALWMYTCVISMFAINKRRNKLGDILIFLLSVYLLTGLDNLRVDVILSLVTIAAIVVLITEQNDAKQMACFLAPFLFTIPLIKNSGILFACIPVCMAIGISTQQNLRRQTWKTAGCGILIPIVSWYLWKAHTKMVYESADWTMHSFSSGSMKSILSMKSEEDIYTILLTYIKKWFSFNDSHEWLAVILIALIGVIALLLCSRKKEVLFVSGVIMGFYLIYKVCLFLMYLLSMVGDEAFELASYERYQQTFTMVMTFVALWLYFEFIQSLNTPVHALVGKRACACMLVLSCFGLCFERYPTLVRPNYAEGGIHRKLVSMIGTDDEMDVGDKVLTYHSYWLAYRLVQHSFDNYTCNSTYDIEEIEEALKTNKERYEWLIILEEDTQIRMLLREYGYPDDVQAIPLIDWSE